MEGDDTAWLSLKARHGVQLGVQLEGCCCSFDASVSCYPKGDFLDAVTACAGALLKPSASRETLRPSGAKLTD